MESLPIPDELVAEIFHRLPSPDDLARASAACASFRRVAADRAFVRRYRKLHPPPLLGFLDGDKGFRPAAPPHPSAPAASAAALAADFSFSFLPGPAADWEVQDVRDGRVLLDRHRRSDWSVLDVFDDRSRYKAVFLEMVVCDPLHRRYLLLPAIPDDLANSVETQLWKTWTRYWETFLLPSEDDEEEETAFRVIWMVQCATKLVAALFSSSTGQWRAVSSQSWSNLFTGLIPPTGNILFDRRQCAYGCFYWVTDCKENMLILDTRRMEFSVSATPDEARGDEDMGIVMVEAGEGRPGMVLRVGDIGHMTADLSYYTLRQDNGGSSRKWHKEKTLVLPGSEFVIRGSMRCYLLLILRWLGTSSVEPGYFTLNVKTLQLERVSACSPYYIRLHAYPYFNFPPSLLSTPAVSSGTQEGTEKAMREQG
ncbi:uncharacterized protein LOC100834805 [Brachypodium distachyon]|uniref:F-box domain-containing protein n=1 Tax=Brachypodium distachyon TaxID=15368 RepID=I1HWB5_BRADI|nr:uncharacterized protein LOC100834805 [Brachypodium distachyon]KQJ92887.1 hypothetical protein BRADI_3g01390v3 [Brachypodium distachyon]|eukprot:XP_010233698.1 uncharacterized protein LOC100834805 [Brachypodium distachyon]